MRQAHGVRRSAALACCTAAAVAMLTAVPAAAIEFRAEQHVVVGAGEVVFDDLYATGETVTVDGRVEGDMIASAREVRLHGEVTGDLMACGQAVVVNGEVGDDVRMAGLALQLGPAASIGDDVVSAGFSLETEPESLTRGSLLFRGFQALLAGEIDESVRGSMNALEIRGGVGGDSELEIGGDPNMPSFAQYIPSPVTLPAVAGGLTVADTARIQGELRYTSAHEARASGTVTGKLTRREPLSAGPEAGQATRESIWTGRLFKWLSLVVLGLLLSKLVPRWLNERSGEIQSNTLSIAGLGLLGVAALPVGLVLAVVVLVVVAVILGFLKLGSLAALQLVLGLVGLGLLILLFWLTSSYLAPLLVGLCTGRWVLQRLAAEKARGLVLPLIFGVVLLALLRFVPFLGFLVALVVLLLGWGAILWWLWKRVRTEEPKPTPSPTAAS